MPEVVANVTFGGPKLNRLFICGTTSLYAVMLPTNGSKAGLNSAECCIAKNAMPACRSAGFNRQEIVPIYREQERK